MEKYKLSWYNASKEGGIRYICGYCGTDTGPGIGYHTNPEGNSQGFVLMCTYCNRPTFVERYKGATVSTTPSAKMGKDVEGLPSDVANLYNEARICTSAGAYTAAVLTCRKILMHVAFAKGAPENSGFIGYVNYLADENYIPREGRDWVDYIRKKSNEANHEIREMSKDDAEDLITFTEMLLRLIYEFNTRLSKKTTATEPPSPPPLPPAPKVP